MLRNSGKPLVKQELQAVVVGADDEAAPPQVRPPVPDRLHQPDQLALVGRQLDVTRDEGPAEERQGARPLVEDGAETRTGGIAVDDELASEIRHLQNRGGGQGPLEGVESLRRLWSPGERLLAQETREWRCDGTEISDELAVVTRKPEETADASG
jgi:hypothetical protein